MIRMNPGLLRGADLFCGAGGMTLGANRSGRVDVRLAVNHWQTAIHTHSINHPDVRHICARIEEMDIRNEHDLGEIDVLMGGIECTHHSNARGGAPINDQRRTSAWRVIDWIGKFRPPWCIFENVREFLDWGPIDDDCRKIKSRKGEIFNAWVRSIRSHNYYVEWKILNAAEHGEATARKRLFIVCRRGGSEEPISWPKRTHGSSADVAAELTENNRCNWSHERTAAEIIDWSKPCPSIFSRKKPLADKTLKRIEIGLRKFVEPFVMQSAGPGWNDPRYAGVFSKDEPLRTLVAKPTYSVVQPSFLCQYHNGSDGDRRSYGVDAPLNTLDTQPRYALARPYLVHMRGTGTAQSAAGPMGTVCGGGNHWYATVPYMFAVNHGGEDGRHRSVGRPLPTITTKRGQAVAMPFMYSNGGRNNGSYPSLRNPMPTLVARNHESVVVPYMIDIHNRRRDDLSRCINRPMKTVVTKPGDSVVMAFLTKFYGTGGAASIHSPLDTITTKHRFGLAQVSLARTMLELGVVDIGFRMLDVDELKAAQGFPADYYLHGNKADRIRQIGNAVCPNVMQHLCEEAIR